MFYFYPVKVWYINITSNFGQSWDVFLLLPAHDYAERRQFGEV